MQCAGLLCDFWFLMHWRICASSFPGTIWHTHSNKTAELITSSREYHSKIFGKTTCIIQNTFPWVLFFIQKNLKRCNWMESSTRLTSCPSATKEKALPCCHHGSQHWLARTHALQHQAPTVHSLLCTHAPAKIPNFFPLPDY
jgi:hypothetical protein